MQLKFTGMDDVQTGTRCLVFHKLQGWQVVVKRTDGWYSEFYTGDTKRSPKTFLEIYPLPDK